MTCAIGTPLPPMVCCGRSYSVSRLPAPTRRSRPPHGSVAPPPKEVVHRLWRLGHTPIVNCPSRTCRGPELGNHDLVFIHQGDGRASGIRSLALPNRGSGSGLFLEHRQRRRREGVYPRKQALSPHGPEVPATGLRQPPDRRPPSIAGQATATSLSRNCGTGTKGGASLPAGGFVPPAELTSLRLAC
jgi:hypothetical protein